MTIYTPTEPNNIPEFAPPYPNSETQEPDVFATNANRQGLWQPVLAENANLLGQWMKATADGTKNNAEIAAAAAALAQGASNYVGKWSELPAEPLPAGSGVSHPVFGQLTGWVSAVDIADPTASEPSLGNDDWFPVGFVPMLYRGPWEAQSGQAVPPYWVDYGGGGNLLLWSEDATQATTNTNLTITPNAAVAPDGTTTADLLMDSSGAVSNAQKAAGITPTAGAIYYAAVDIKYESGDASCALNTIIAGAAEECNIYFNASTGIVTSALGSTLLTYGVKSRGNGWWRVHLVFTTSGGSDIIVRVWPNARNNPSLTGGVYAWGWQLVKSSGVVRYVKTTTDPAPCTPPKIYELQAPVDAIEEEDDPITDGGVLWKEIGSGDGSGAGTATEAERVFTSADQDGSSNIAVTLDASLYTEWQLDFNGSPLPNTSGAYNIAMENLADAPTNVEFFHIRMKRAGRKTVNLTATNESSASLTVSWLEAPTFLATSGAWDMVTLHRWPANPNILFASLNDGRT